MGKLALLLVLAAAVGGTVLTIGVQRTLGAAAGLHAGTQADVLAREIAESGQQVALAQMLGDDGFRPPAVAAGAYGGGTYEVVVDSLTPTAATITVTGAFGGAVHRIQSTHQYDPLDAPGPLWLDVPYATGTLTGSPRIGGGPEGRSVVLDRRRHDEHALESFLPLAGLTSELAAVAAAGGGELSVPAAEAWTGASDLLQDLNVEDTEGLYHAVVNALDVAGGDTYVDGDLTVASPLAKMGPERVTVVDGDATVTATGSVTGEGALVVNGDLRVEPGGRLAWTGLVLVRSTDDVLTIALEGSVDIDGALAVAHTAFPPGGHMDVSVYRDRDGMDRTHGDLAGANHQWGWRPWYEHTHMFDQTPSHAPRGTHVYYLEDGGAGRHEAEVEFDDFLDGLDGSTEVYLEFANAHNHGSASYRVGLDGRSPVVGTVRGGFPDAFRAPAGPQTRTAPFRAGDLRDLDVNVRSLRSLEPFFNTPTSPCGDWPVCIGNDWGREGALAVRLMRASDGARLYESTLYWHMKGAEIAAHAAAEQAWRAEIAAGGAFGTHLTLGSGVDLTYDRGALNDLAGKLGFDGDELLLVETASTHTTAAEARSETDRRPGVPDGETTTGRDDGADTPVADDPAPAADEARQAMCNGNGQTVAVKLKKVAQRLNQGWSFGACSAGSDDDGDDDDDDDD
jgi:hypothetical protein